MKDGIDWSNFPAAVEELKRQQIQVFVRMFRMDPDLCRAEIRLMLARPDNIFPDIAKDVRAELVKQGLIKE